MDDTPLIITPPQTREPRLKDTGFKLLAALGLVVVLTAVAWGGIALLQYIPSAMRSVANAFVGLQSVFVQKEQIIISTDRTQLTSKEPFVLSFDYRGTPEAGSYAFVYECREGVYFQTTRAGRNDIIVCNTPYTLQNDITHIALTPISTSEASVVVPAEIRFTTTGASRTSATGTITLTIVNPSLVTTDTTGGTTTTSTGTTNTGNGTPTPDTGSNVTVQFGTTTVGVTNNPYGRADLVVHVLATGVVDRVTNEFTASSSVRSVDRAGVKFEIVNQGDRFAEGWAFSAVLPTYPSFIYQSPQQQTLYPGDKIVFTLGFDSIKDLGDNIVTINADNIGSVKESNEDNNVVHTTIVVKNQ